MEATQLYTTAKSAFNSGKMNLREWMSNDEQFLSSIPEEDRAGMEPCKMLGYWYSPKIDAFWVAPHQPVGIINSKRKALQCIGKTYDPMGLWAPTTFQAKCEIQKLWVEEISWDAPILEAMTEQWTKLEADLLNIPRYQIPRHIGFNITLLICFTDASEKGYATTVYGKSSIGINILFSKTRLTPLKESLTIARLELLGVTKV